MKLEVSEIIVSLLTAVVMSSLVGFDREYKNRPAGIRTHVLVCVGATIIALIQREIGDSAIQMATNNPELSGVLRSDRGRLIAQVVSGIGFLGAGTIVVTKQAVTGLTTAASLWTVAGLGIAVGLGYYPIAILGFIVVYIVLTFLHKVIRIPTLKKIEVKYIHRKETKEFISRYFEENKVSIRDVNFSVEFKEDYRIYTNVYTVELPKGIYYPDIIEAISVHSNVVKIRLISI